MFIKRLILMVALVFVSVVACDIDKTDNATKEYLKQYSDQKKPLAVDFFTPEGDTNITQNKIVVHFTQPMVALSAIGDSIQTDLVEITPRPKGYFKWANSKTLVYQVEGNLPYATDFKVRVNPGKPSLLGFALTKEVEFKFATAAPRVVRVLPQINATNIKLKQPFEIQFNQEVEPGQPWGRLWQT